MSYRNLEIYNKSFELALSVHKYSLQFPSQERFELGAQLRKASKSISLNIAEGNGRKTYPKDFTKYLINAIGSLNETKVCLDFAFNLGYIDQKQFNCFFEEYEVLGKRIYKLVTRLQKS